MPSERDVHDDSFPLPLDLRGSSGVDGGDSGSSRPSPRSQNADGNGETESDRNPRPEGNHADETAGSREKWLIAAWPGMGSVAVTAAEWLNDQLQTLPHLDLEAPDIFEVEMVEVHDGIARVGWRPKSQFQYWRHPGEGPDLLILVGEAQPASRGLEYCHRILRVALDYGVTRVVTFAAMGTQQHPKAEPRVFAVANEARLLDELRPHPVEFLREGQIKGLNGVLLAAAAEVGVDAVCLLGEMPIFAAPIPNPSAAVAVLQVFAALSGVTIELHDLIAQGSDVDERLSASISNLSQVVHEEPPEMEQEFELPPLTEPVEVEEIEMSIADRLHIESLFRSAEADRQQAAELKSELDRLGVFERYEDRFLDLFRPGN